MEAPKKFELVIVRFVKEYFKHVHMCLACVNSVVNKP